MIEGRGSGNASRGRRARLSLLALALAMALAGCAAAAKVGGVFSDPLGSVGITAPSTPSMPSVPETSSLPDGSTLPNAPSLPETPTVPNAPERIRDVRLTIDTSVDLNSDDRGRGLALITRVYKLKNPNVFLQASQDSFLKPGEDKTTLGSDLVDVQELVLTPGQHFEAHELLGNDSPWLGVVALFRSPAPYRWRFVFKASRIDRNGIVIGAHACALTVTAGLVGNDGTGRPLGQLPPFCR